MIFSSPIFLFLFLPLTLLGYYLSPKGIKNYWLLLASLVFFAWGGVSYTLIIVCSIIVNYFFGLLIDKHKNSAKAKRFLYGGVTINLIVLGIFKYANFITKNINEIFNWINLPKINETDIILPVGISFYTFHLLSYLIDIYRGKTNAQKNIFDLALYVCMFSQLVAGPIIRYSDVGHQLKNRIHSLTLFSEGIERFIIGLGKKVILANTFASIADPLFSADPNGLSALNAWLAMVAYTFQIYCDFAGYSDMAVGLGKMFGFNFMENFNFPYLATSIKDFWRRWHISLSTFFRDYVYIPLGGNRVSASRNYFNLIIVFFITGFWHGASWNFVFWGMFHGFFIVIERLGFDKVLNAIWNPFKITYAFIVVMFAWVLFKYETFEKALHFWKELFDFKIENAHYVHFMRCFDNEFLIVLMITIMGSFGLITLLLKKVEFQINKLNLIVKHIFDAGYILFYMGILILCASYLIAGTYNPFIYYKF
jgi:alginate O-acetyltransferase complex protein AlgI